MSAPVLIFDNVTLRANGNVLLGPVTTRIDTPGITVVMGPNGAGKSLFLSAAHGLAEEVSGAVTWDGVAATGSRAARGFVFQETPVMRRSVAGNIVFPLLAQGVGRAKRARLLQEALGISRLTELARKPAATLSGGERKRLALARAMVTEPVAILLDEPASNLDPATTAELEDSLRRISSRGVKVILSTHDINQARRLASDILFFAQGNLVEQGPADAFFDRPASDAARRFLKGDL